MKPAIDALQTVFPASPVVLDGLDVFDDGGIQLAVKVVRRMRLARTRLEQVLDPQSALSQSLPKQVRLNLPLDQLFPKHSLRNHV